MAADIIATATGSYPPDALIVSIPSPVVEDAVEEATKYVPIFGMNSGYDVAERVGVLDFVSMDEHLGGVKAAEEFLSKQQYKNNDDDDDDNDDDTNSTTTNALYIDHRKSNKALDQRLRGFQEGLGEEVHELVVDLTLSDDEIIEWISSALDGCKYDFVLLASSTILEYTTTAFYANSCSLSDHLLGTFDTGAEEYAAIATGKLLFAISQQPHLQATMSVIAAATYVTTGKRLSRSKATFGTFLAGPMIINLENLPSDTLQICEEDAFPVCPNNLAPDSVTRSSCDCLDRSKITIAGVIHGVTTDDFWDVVFAQARQAADDLGVEIKLSRLEPQPTQEILISKMAQQIISLCQRGVDGIFVTIPSDLVHPAIKECQALNIPVVSINSGAQDALELGLVYHISQLEYEGGFQAGTRMALEGITGAICLLHEADNSALSERCEGFEAGLKEVLPDIEYLGAFVIAFDSKVLFIEELEKAVGKEGDWMGLGALSLGVQTVGPLLEVKKLHPKLLFGTFDINNEVYEALDSGTILFGIDQNPFMQGYMPVWLLTIMVHTKQQLQNIYIQTGPRFVDEAPSKALQVCTANFFEVCARPVDYNYNQLTKIRPVGLTMAAFSMLLSIALSVWVGINRKAAVIRKSQPIFLVMICIGTLLMASAIIPLSIDDSIASYETCTNACIASPWLLSIGFTTTFSALFAKIYRINTLMRSARLFRKVKISAWDVMLPFFILLTITLIFLLVWTVVDPMYWIRQDVFGSTDGLSTYGICMIGRTNISKAMIASLVVLAFACVILACVAAWRGREISIEYSESKYVGLVMIVMLQLLLLGIPLNALVNTNPPAGCKSIHLILSIFTIYISFMDLILLFFVRLCEVCSYLHIDHVNSVTDICAKDYVPLEGEYR